MKHRLGIAMVVAALLLTVLPGMASADGDEESDRAYDLVRQAIALIVNTPDDMEMIVDKTTDATEAKDPAGVDIGLVQLAKDAICRYEQHEDRLILLHRRARTHRHGRPRADRTPRPQHRRGDRNGRRDRPAARTRRAGRRGLGDAHAVGARRTGRRRAVIAPAAARPATSGPGPYGTASSVL